jgi:hypothetical protein
VCSLFIKKSKGIIRRVFHVLEGVLMSMDTSTKKICVITILFSIIVYSGCKKNESISSEQGKKTNATVMQDKKSDDPLINNTVKDTTRPKVKECSPPKGKDDVVINDPIAVVFNEPINEETVKDMFLVVSESGETLSGKVICKDSTVMFKPDKDLEYGMHYTVRLKNKVADMSGNRIAKDVVWDFSTNQAIMARLRVINGESIILSDITGYDFFEQEVKVSTDPVPFTLRNEGNANLVIKSIAFSSGDAGQFAIATPSLPVTLLPNKEIHIAVVFTPQSSGKKTAILKIRSNDGVMGFFHLLMTGKGI